MADKEIIIDGVDVSGCCKHGETFYGITCGLPERIRFGNKYIYKHTLCKDKPNCEYKQLQRKTKECEGLQHQIDKIKNYVKSNMFDVDCVNWFERFIYTFEDWKKSIVKNEDKYKQALDEIEKELKEDIYCENQECGCDDFEECLKCTKEYIIDIISKAKDGN